MCLKAITRQVKMAHLMITSFHQRNTTLCESSVLLQSTLACNKWLVFEHAGELGMYVKEMVNQLKSVAWCFFVLGVRQCEEILQLPLKSLKSGPFHGVFVPALQHNIIQGWRATLRTLHSIAMFNLVKHFSICHTWKKSKCEFDVSFWFSQVRHKKCMTYNIPGYGMRP